MESTRRILFGRLAGAPCVSPMQKEAGEGCQGDGNPPTPEREGRYYDSDVTNSFLVPFGPRDRTAPYPFASSPRHRGAESADQSRPPGVNSRQTRHSKASSGMTARRGESSIDCQSNVHVRRANSTAGGLFNSSSASANGRRDSSREDATVKFQPDKRSQPRAGIDSGMPDDQGRRG